MKNMFAVVAEKGAAASLAVLLVALCLSGCAHPHLGKKVDTRSPVWCAVRGLPQVCSVKTEYFTFTCRLSQGAASDEYVIEGSATSAGLGSFTSLVDGPIGGNPPSRFELLLVKDGVIKESIPLSMLGTDLSRGFTFKRVFKSAPFDAMTIWYMINVRG